MPDVAFDAGGAVTSWATFIQRYHTVGAYDDLYGLVGLHAHSAIEPIYTATWNSVAMTLIGSRQTQNETRLWLWKIANPTTGWVYISFAGHRDILLGTRSYYNVDDIVYAGDASGTTGTPSNTVVIGGNSAGRVADHIGCRWSGSAGAGQTQRYGAYHGGIPAYMYGSDEAWAASVPMTWATGSGYWTSLAAYLSPLPSGGLPSSGFFFSKVQKFYEELKLGLIPAWDLQRRYREVYA